MKDNIILRPLEQKDAPLILEWLKDKEVTRFFRFDTENATIDSVQAFINDSRSNSENIHFAISDTKDDEYLGTVSLKNIDKNAKTAEYAISLRKKAHGKRYGYEATIKILDYAFSQLDLERVYLNVLSDNEKAIRLYEKLGFIYEGEFLNHIVVRNELKSLKWFRLTKYEYEQRIKNHKRYTFDDIKILSFPEFKDKGGLLTVIEGCKDIPFNIKRVFYIHGVTGVDVRGEHANRYSHFCLINVSGSCKVKVIDYTGQSKVFVLDRPNMGLYLPPMIWKDMYDFTTDAIQLVLSSEYYDSNEYIRNLDDFFKGG